MWREPRRSEEAKEVQAYFRSGASFNAASFLSFFAVHIASFPFVFFVPSWFIHSRIRKWTPRA